MRESHTPLLEYLECPVCGARYLARDQRGFERFGSGARWFSCHRCKRRVQSAHALEQELITARCG